MDTPKGPYEGIKNILKKIKKKNEEFVENLEIDKKTYDNTVVQEEIGENLQNSDITRVDLKNKPFFGDFLSDDFILENLYVIEEDPETTDKKWKDYMRQYPNIMDGNIEERNTVSDILGNFFIKKYNSEGISEREINLVKEFLQRVSEEVLPPEVKKSFRDTILHSNLTYGIIDELYQAATIDPHILRDGELRSTFKDENSPFRFECMLAYLQQNESQIKKIEEIIALALKIKHHDGTNSKIFIKSMNDIVLNTIAKDYAVPESFTKRTEINEEKINKILEYNPKEKKEKQKEFQKKAIELYQEFEKKVHDAENNIKDPDKLDEERQRLIQEHGKRWKGIKKEIFGD